jgi:hypothetical protein
MTLKGSIFMTYEKKISTCRTRGTRQCGALSIERRLLKERSLIGDHGSIRRFQKAGIPVHRGVTQDKAYVTSPGTEGGLYPKGSRKSGIAHKARCECYRRIVERYCYAGPEGISEEKGVWPKSVVRFRCFTATIVWAMRRSRRSTGCLFQRRSGGMG